MALPRTRQAARLTRSGISRLADYRPAIPTAGQVAAVRSIETSERNSKYPLVNIQECGELVIFNGSATPAGLLVARRDIKRGTLAFQNQSAALDLWVNFGAPAGLNLGWKIAAGGYYEPKVLPIGDLYAWSSGSCRFAVTIGPRVF